MNPNPKALIITVNYRQAECTIAFLRSAAHLLEFHQCQIFIVDNNSRDDSTSRIRAEAEQHENVELLDSDRNRGYFGAAKWALDKYREIRSLPDWTIVCNNDIVFDDSSFLTRLFNQEAQSVGLLAPEIISERSGLDSNPMITTKPGRLRILRYRFLLSTYSLAWLTQFAAPHVRKGRHRLRSPRTKRNRQFIYAPHGSLLVFSRHFFQSGGSLDDGSFLFGEELGVAETCVRLGLPIVHEPSLHVFHKDNRSTGRVLTREMYQHQKRGLQYAIDNYLKPPVATADRKPAGTCLADSSERG